MAYLGLHEGLGCKTIVTVVTYLGLHEEDRGAPLDALRDDPI